MSSIAYVTDNKMIEYHRINGNTSMNFWRAGTTKKFTDFKKDDLLFFLAKGTERRNEKGIIGYGRFMNSQNLTIHQMWKKFGTLNGYSSENELEEAIQKMYKEVPEKMNCLYLDQVVFFGYPIYLSELGIQVSNKLETYIYLDKEDRNVTAELLNLANDVGIDLWSTHFSTTDEGVIQKEEVKHQLAGAFNRIESSYYTNNDSSRNYKLMKTFNSTHEFEFIKGSRSDCYKLEDNTITIAIPFLMNTKDMVKRLQYCIGHIQLYKVLLDDLSKRYSIRYQLVSDTELTPFVKQVIEGLNHE